MTQTTTMFSSAVYTLDILQRVYMRAVAYVSPVKTCPTVFGAIMRCRTRDFVQRRVRFFGIFEHNLTYYTLERLRSGDGYLDIGANVGYFTLLASRRVGPRGKVISVEADPSTFAALQTNIALNGCRNIEARNVAATAAPCRVMIERGEAHNSGSHHVVEGSGAGSVQGLPFRDLAGEDIGRLRFIKIDIEGAEAPVLASILESLGDLPDDLVVASEVSPSSAEHVARFVAAGFKAYAMQNVYTIDYYLMRAYLRRYGEGRSVEKFAVSQFDPSYRDYVFERQSPLET